MSPFSMYLVKYNASPGLPPSLYDSKRGYGLTNEALIWSNATEIANNIKSKRILPLDLYGCLFSLFSNLTQKINDTPADIRTIRLKMLNYICHKEQKQYQVLTESVKTDKLTHCNLYN